MGGVSWRKPFQRSVACGRFRVYARACRRSEDISISDIKTRSNIDAVSLAKALSVANCARKVGISWVLGRGVYGDV